MKVCFFLTYGMSLKRWDELGILERELALYKKLSARGVCVSLFTYGDRRDLDYAVRFPHLRIFPAYADIKKPKARVVRFVQSFSFAQRFKAFFQEHDLFKTNQLWGIWIPLKVQTLFKKPLILRMGYEAYSFALLSKSPWYVRLLVYGFSQAAYQRAEAVFLSSHSAKDFARKTFRVAREKVHVIPNAVDFESIPDSDPAQIRQPKRVLFVGRLEEQKNLLNAILAVQRNSIGLDIIGQGSLKTVLQAFVEKHRADVRFFEPLTNALLLQKIKEYPFCLLPSLYEGSPKVLLEMMACGKAVVGTRVQGIEEIIQDGETGILTGTSAEEIAQGIKKLMDFPELSRQMGLKARRYAEEQFSLEKIADREYQIYQSLLENQKQVWNGGSTGGILSNIPLSHSKKNFFRRGCR